MASSAAILSRVEMCTEHLVNCPLNGFHNVFNLMCTEKWPLNEAGEGGVYNLELNFDRLAAEQQSGHCCCISAAQVFKVFKAPPCITFIH